MRFKCCLIFVFAVCVCINTHGRGGYVHAEPASSIAVQAQSLAVFKERIRPILVKNCFKCHGPEKQKAKLRLDTLNPDLIKSTSAETWHDVLNNLNLGEMPPDDEPALKAGDRKALVNWLTGSLKHATELKKQTGGKVVMRRLTRYEYNNTMRDLLGLDIDFAANLPPEPKSKDGFKNNGLSLGISPIQMEYYLDAARKALAKVIVTGERPELVKFESSKTEKPAKGYSQAKDGKVLPGTMYVVNTRSFPREGLIRVRIAVEVEDTKTPVGYSRMRVSLGHRADTQSPDAALGDVDVIPAKGEQVYEFIGRIEKFPLPGHNPKFPGMRIAITNEFDSGIDIKKLRQQIASTEKAAAKRKKLLAAGKKVSDRPVPALPDIPEMPSFVIKSITFEGPIYDAWPPSQHGQILFEKSASIAEADYAKQVIERFISRAYRRPATPGDVNGVYDFYKSIRPDMASFEAAIRESLAMVLISPKFLYLVEPASGRKGLEKLTNHELASRLSYFLWSSMPDAELRAAADAGKLSQAAEVEKQVKRMIKDKRSRAFVENFTTQWLDLSGLERVAVNPEYYPDFNNDLKRHMKGETLSFVEEVLRKNLSALTLIDSDFVMINAPMARHYGLSGPRGMAFERVALKPADRRGGLLAQASILLINSTGEDSHPIRRAVWLRDRLLDDPPAPPPPDVPELKQEDPNFASLPLKRQLELHREKASCNDCHAQIDPWGVPFEHYDAIGRWRDQVSRKVAKKKAPVLTPVVSEATLPGGHAVSGLDDLKTHLKTHQRTRFALAVVRKVLAYSLGRSLEFTDAPEVAALLEQFEASDYHLSELIVGIAKSNSFSSK